MEVDTVAAWNIPKQSQHVEKVTLDSSMRETIQLQVEKRKKRNFDTNKDQVLKYKNRNQFYIYIIFKVVEIIVWWSFKAFSKFFY